MLAGPGGSNSAATDPQPGQGCAGEGQWQPWEPTDTPNPPGQRLSGAQRGWSCGPRAPCEPRGGWGSGAHPATVVPRGCPRLGRAGGCSQMGTGVSFCLSPRGWLGLGPQGSLGMGRDCGAVLALARLPRAQEGWVGRDSARCPQSRGGSSQLSPLGAPGADPGADPGAGKTFWTGGGAASSCRERPGEAGLRVPGTEALSWSSRPLPRAGHAGGSSMIPPPGTGGPASAAKALE